MLYKIKPDYNLADLSESKVYKQVAQLATKRQLVQGLRASDNTTLYAIVTDLDIYYINVKCQSRLLL